VTAPQEELLKTPLHALHAELGARMVPFAGYSMPVQYPAGLMAEHLHTRSAAGLFDVSHMGQLRLVGADAAAAFESVVPVDVIGLGVDRQRYGLLLTDAGTVIDDLMFVNRGDHLFVIVNGACKVGDIAHLQDKIGGRCQVVPMPDHALLALQGPQAVDALARLVPGVEELVFMTGKAFRWNGAELYVTRSGYTGEDGFELVVPASEVVSLWHDLVAVGVRPCGLGARDTLRLEAGMNLYGQDMDELTFPAEAGLSWTVSLTDTSRDFIGRGALAAFAAPTSFVGLKLAERGVMRAHMTVHTDLGAGETTSGTMSPTLGVSVAFARVPKGVKAGDRVEIDIRGKRVPATVCKLPFVRFGKAVGT